MKSSKYADALKEVAKLEQDSAVSANPRLYAWGVEANVGLNDAQNEKIYLKQKYDTAQFFTTTYGIYEYIGKCDSVEKLALGTKPKYRKQNTELVQKYYKNLVAGGRYYYVKGDRKQTCKFLSLALDLPKKDLWTGDSAIIASEDYVRNAVLVVRSAYLEQDYATVRKYEDVALRDTGSARPVVLECLARTALASSDTATYLNYLHKGIECCAEHAFFYTRLADNYAAHSTFLPLLSLSDSLLASHPRNLYFMLGRSISLINLAREPEAIETLQEMVSIDSALVEPYYYLGAAYYNLGEDIELPLKVGTKTYKAADKARKEYFSKAMPYLETYRKMDPNRKDRWAPLLYTVYLVLNQGEKFAEINQILTSK